MLERETGLEPATSSLGIQASVESTSLARFCREFLNLQHVAESAFAKSVWPNEAQTRQLHHAWKRLPRCGNEFCFTHLVRDAGCQREACWSCLRETGVDSRVGLWHCRNSCIVSQDVFYSGRASNRPVHEPRSEGLAKLIGGSPTRSVRPSSRAI